MPDAPSLRGLAEQLVPASPDLATKAAVGALACAGCELVFRGLPLVTQRRVADVSRHDTLANNAVSVLHAALVGGAAARTVSRHHRRRTPALTGAAGELGLVASVAYMAWDATAMVRTRYEPLVPLLAHHALSGLGMAYVAFRLPEGTFYACMLLLSEFTVPLQQYVWLLEHQKREAARRYRAARWALVPLWLAARVALFGAFGLRVRDDWPRMPPALRAMAVGCGAALAVFNLAGLALVVLPGLPRLRRARGQEEKI